MHFKLSHRGLVLVAVPLVFEIAFVTILMYLLHTADVKQRELEHSRAVLAADNEARQSTYNLAVSILFFMSSRTEAAREKLDKLLVSIPETGARTLELLKDDPTEAPLGVELVKEQEIGLSTIKKIKTGLESGEGLEGYASVADLQRLAKLHSDKVFKLLDQIADIEMKKGITAEDEERLKALVREFIIAFLFVNIGVAILLSIYFTGSISKRLSVIVTNAVRLSSAVPLLPPVPGNDEIARLDKAFHNMAKSLKEAARQESALVENATDVIFSLDKDNQFSKVNHAALSIWEYAPEELIGRRMIDIVETDDRESLLSFLAGLKTKEPKGSIEMMVKKKSTSTAFTSLSAYWYADEETVFCVARDVTDKHRIEELKQEFIAMITHDLRAPLSSIKATIELLGGPAGSSLSSEWRQRLKTAEESSSDLMNLINDLLDLEKMRSGKLDLELEVCQVREVIERSIASLKTLSESREVSLHFQGEDLFVIADKRRLQQVVVNLLSNAIKFSAAGQPVQVISKPMEGFAEVSVKDKGRGIPADKIETIFNRFDQVSARDAYEKGGAGLGLSIAKTIVDQHGGTIGVESKPEEGSRFWFRMPLAD